MSQLDSGLGQLSSKSPELVRGINQLYTGVESYTGGVSDDFICLECKCRKHSSFSE